MSMDEQAIKDCVLTTLRRIAPELDPQDLAASEPLRDQIDLDSVDWLNFLVGINETLKVDIPEADYAGLRSFDDIVNYLRQKLGA